MAESTIAGIPPTVASGTQIKSRHMKALLVKGYWSYNDSESYVPATLKGSIPNNFKDKDGNVLFHHGSQGFFVSFSPDGQWCRAAFVRQNTSLDIIIPKNLVQIGAPWKPLGEKLVASQELLPVVRPAELAIQGTKLENFIRTFWRGCSQQSTAFIDAGLPEADAVAMFQDSTFRNNVDTITSAFTPQVRAAIQDGNFNIATLSKLPKVSENWPPVGAKCVYLRLYTHQDAAHQDLDNFAIYGGQVRRHAYLRDQQHEDNIDTQGLHYVRARKSPKEHRVMIPLIVWSPQVSVSLSPQVINMAEQTVVSMFDCEHPSHVIFPLLRRRISLLTAVKSQARQSTGWPALNGRGCNVLAPMFPVASGGAPIYCIPMPSRFPGDRGMTVYRRVATLNKRDWKDCYGVSFRYYLPDSKPWSISFSIPTEVARQYDMKAGFPGYLVFEIMHDGKPHHTPWIGCPEFGPFKNFSMPSCLGVRFEWFQQSSNNWFSVPFDQPGFTAQFRQGVKANDQRLAIQSWHKAMNVIQMLEGITYSGPIPEGFYSTLSLGAIDVFALEMDHLKQTARWVPRQGKIKEAPKVATVRDNAELLAKKFPQTGTNVITLVNQPRRVPNDSDFWRATEGDVKAVNRMKTPMRCDFTIYMDRNDADLPCEDSPSCQGTFYQCICCALMHRPCTFTAASNRVIRWGQGPPWIRTPSFRLSLFPTGDHYCLAFYRVGFPKDRVTVVEAPFQGREGLGVIADMGDAGYEDEDNKGELLDDGGIED